MKINDQLLFLIGKKSSLQIRSKIISPSKPTALTTPFKASKLRNGSPTALAVGEDETNEFLVLLGSPRPFLDP